MLLYHYNNTKDFTALKIIFNNVNEQPNFFANSIKSTYFKFEIKCQTERHDRCVTSTVKR